MITDPRDSAGFARRDWRKTSFQARPESSLARNVTLAVAALMEASSEALPTSLAVEPR